MDLAYQSRLKRFAYRYRVLDSFNLATISAPYGSIAARIVSFGITLAELWVPDRTRSELEVVLDGASTS